jgi:DNA-binding NarL/FixJ family response regulator
MNEAQPIRVAICDDHRIVADGIRALLRHQPGFTVVGEALNGDALLHLLEQTTADVVLMDINMGVENGIDLTTRLLRVHPTVRVLGLTMRSDLASVSELFAAGASGYLLKNTGVEELCNAIRTVQAGGRYTAAEITEHLLDRFNKPGSQVIHLSERERKILQHLSDGLTTKAIAGKIFLSEETVKWYRKNLLARFDQPNVAALIKWAMREGLVK